MQYIVDFSHRSKKIRAAFEKELSLFKVEQFFSGLPCELSCKKINMPLDLLQTQFQVLCGLRI